MSNVYCVEGDLVARVAGLQFKKVPLILKKMYLRSVIVQT
jgi:hypothetical protein